jgi:hypothetical protein
MMGQLNNPKTFTSKKLLMDSLPQSGDKKGDSNSH